MSQKRARLRALASLGLSIIVLGALAPTTSAASDEALAQFVVPIAIDPILANQPFPGISPGGPSTLVDGPDGATSRRHAHDVAPPPPTTIAASARVIALAETHLGARYQHGATGPHAFDCSGLVYRVFEDAGLGRKIDGLQSASALYAHFRALHMTSTHAPQLGDLVIFGHGSHVGIYIGSGRVIHAMTSGVAITRISAVYPSFTTYVHLGLTRLRVAAVAGH